MIIYEGIIYNNVKDLIDRLERLGEIKEIEKDIEGAFTLIYQSSLDDFDFMAWLKEEKFFDNLEERLDALFESISPDAPVEFDCFLKKYCEKFGISEKLIFGLAELYRFKEE